VKHLGKSLMWLILLVLVEFSLYDYPFTGCNRSEKLTDQSCLAGTGNAGDGDHALAPGRSVLMGFEQLFSGIVTPIEGLGDS